MTKKEEFKNFVKTKPYLIKYVENNEMTWQKFYEIYDLYGADEKVWEKYLSQDRNLKNLNVSEGLNKLTNLVKNMDLDSIKSHINTAQKAIDLVQDLTLKKGLDKTTLNINKGPSSPRPLNKFFED